MRGLMRTACTAGVVLFLAVVASAGERGSLAAELDSYLEDSAYDRTRLLSQFELAFALPQATRADEANIPEDESWKDKRHWSGLPFMADEALKRGYDLPLPLGVGVSYVYLERLIEVRDVQIGINGAPLQPVDRLFFEDTPSQVHNVMARLRCRSSTSICWAAGPRTARRRH